MKEINDQAAFLNYMQGKSKKLDEFLQLENPPKGCPLKTFRMIFIDDELCNNTPNIQTVKI